MFGIKRGVNVRLNQYLNQVSPWAKGKYSRGWYQSDFAPKEVKADRLNPAAVIFPVPAMNISSFDRLFLTPNQWRLVMNFQHSVSNFNAMLDALNRTPVKDKETRYKLITALHVGCIGTHGTGGLLDSFNMLKNSLVVE